MAFNLPIIDREKIIEVDRVRGLILVVMSLILILPWDKSYCSEPPDQKDILYASAGMGLALGIEVFAKDYFLPVEPRFSTPNRVDRCFREKLYWGDGKRKKAETWSNRLLFGVSLSSLLWGPLTATDHMQAAVINMNVFSANSIITNLIKIRAARERPYHYYGTRPSDGPADNTSFVSGHSSVAFSQAVSNAMILSGDYPERASLIWPVLLGSAGMTAYLRVAGDMHYFSDIFFGACIGSVIGWAITTVELERFSRVEDTVENMALDQVSSGKDFILSIKIPLG